MHHNANVTERGKARSFNGGGSPLGELCCGYFHSRSRDGQYSIERLKTRTLGIAVADAHTIGLAVYKICQNEGF